jgi:hypothetical protein
VNWSVLGSTEPGKGANDAEQAFKIGGGQIP